MSAEVKHNNGPCILCKGCEQDSDFDYCRACGFTNEPIKIKDADCPFCGSLDLLDMSSMPGGGISCKDQNCAAYMANIPRAKWNRRSTVSMETAQVLVAELNRQREISIQFGWPVVSIDNAIAAFNREKGGQG